MLLQKKLLKRLQSHVDSPTLPRPLVSPAPPPPLAVPSAPGGIPPPTAPGGIPPTMAPGGVQPRRRQISTISSYTSVFGSPPSNRIGANLHGNDEDFAAGMEKFGSVAPGSDSYRLTMEQMLERSDVLANGRGITMVRGDKVTVMALKFLSPEAARDWLPPNTKDNLSTWDFIEMRPHPLIEHPATKSTYAVYFEIPVEHASVLQFATHTSSWKERFGFVSLKADRSFLWHYLSNSELIRLIILSTHLEQESLLYLTYPSDWRLAVTCGKKILDAWENRVTRDKVESFLTLATAS